MKDRVVGSRAAVNVATRAALFAALLSGTLQLLAATPDARAKTALQEAHAGVARDFAVLARARPKKCPDEKAPEPGVRGWRGSAAQCAWQNRLQVRRWKEGEDSAPNRCLSKQARWWAWARPRVAPVTWNEAWLAQSLLDESGAKKRVAIIERTADGSWMATEWTWVPSPRTATRKWQEGRWKLLIDAAMQMRQSERKEPVLPEGAALRTAWEKNLKGAAGEVSAGSWLWERDGLCMRMETVGISQAQLHLPYSREDGRLEQRAAMQLRLARTYPKATWLTPFRLLPLPDSAARGGAKYEAIWLENATVKGQLWMPTKVEDDVLRARIAVALPAKRDNDADSGAADAIARAIDRELTGVATIWAFDHEQ